MATVNKYNEQQEAANKNRNNNSQSNEERLKNYFTTNLPKGDTSGTKKFRIVEMPNGEAFEAVSFHSVKVGDNWLKLFDPAQENNKLWKGETSTSPLNDLRKTLYQTGKEEDKKEAKKYFSRVYFIVKGVEIDNDGNIVDGQPKFWRFPMNQKGEGTMDKIMAHINREINNGNNTPIWDLNNGKTLELELKRVENPMKKGAYYTKVTQVFLDPAAPVTDDSDLMQKLQNDEKVWTDVYSVRPETYLRIVADGETPKYSKEKDDWISVSSETSEGSASMSDVDEYSRSNNSTQNETSKDNKPKETPKSNVMEDTVESTDIDDDDLPF